MDASAGAALSATNSFEPSSDLIHEEECDTLLLYLPGFTKEQLRVQLTRSGILKISGIRPVGDNKWSSFQKDFPVSPNCDTNKISAKFEGGILYVRQPKLIVPADKDEDNKTPPAQPQQSTPTPTNEPPPAQKVDQEPKPDGQSKQTSTNKEAADHSQESSAQGKEAKPAKEKEKAAATTSSANDKRERTAAQADARKTTNDGGAAKADEHKVSAGSPAAKLRTARQTVMMVLAVVFAFGLGIYISRMNWFSGKAAEE
ncbi:UNVERIFIED_CONTAM: hypothetical protein Sradi_0232300 [Sesamum radiatum]|uniref:SHSP domain-containing protein n=1 Tax=Sesamum radiatum TaxID=300843 RepID=A0AAW2VZY0_SESRA